MVLRRWERSKQKFGFIKRVDKGEITTVKDLESFFFGEITTVKDLESFFFGEITTVKDLESFFFFLVKLPP